MTRTASFIQCTGGLAVAIWLFSKAGSTYVLSGMLVASAMLVLYVPVAVVVWIKRPQARGPLLVTGFSLLMSLSLVLRITQELTLVAFPGWSSKEMGQALPREVPPECIQQWYIDEIGRIRSERNIYGGISAVLALLFFSQLKEFRSSIT